MSFRHLLKAVRRFASAGFTWAWHFGFLVIGRLTRSTARPWSSSGRERVLVVSPHPDDEAIACSGTMLRHLASGDGVVIAIATDGRRSRAASSPDEMASIRRKEAARAAQALGVGQLVWLGLPEGAWQPAELERLLSELLTRFGPTIVYAPSRIDFHPEHWAVARALARALDAVSAGQSVRARVRIYQVQVPLTRILTNCVVDISDGIGQSDAALQSYGSQAGSIEFLRRRRRYSACSHRAQGPVEEFWELSPCEYAWLHHGRVQEWSGKFRGLRRFAWTDPLAYVLGNRERRRLRARIATMAPVAR